MTIKKAVILAGGLGTRLSEETAVVPKPLVSIGTQPILWHIMKIFSHYGVDHFIVCLGYKGYLIKEFFVNYHLHTSDVTVDLGKNSVEVHAARAEPWKVTLVDTGQNTQTGGRLKKVESYIGSEPFFMTYGDGVGDVDLAALEKFHRSHGKSATVTAVRPPGRFGSLQISDDNSDRVDSFLEKPLGDGGWINGGYFILHPQCLSLIDGDATVWENEPLKELSKRGELYSHKHQGFWQPMDTLRDKRELETLWNSGKAPWKIWE